MNKILTIFSIVFVTWGACKSADTVSCSARDINHAILLAGWGDTISVRSGKAIWSNKDSCVRIDKAVTLMGAGRNGRDSTVIILGKGGSYINASCVISAPATIRGFYFFADTGLTNESMISVTPRGNDFRITDCEFNSRKYRFAYSIYSSAYGLIDSNYFYAGNETVFTRGHSTSWQEPSSFGKKEKNLFIENNVAIYDKRTSNAAIFVDLNDNSRGVVRYNYFDNYYVDGHGRCTNSMRSVRHWEVYRNYTSDMNSWTAIHMRGGTGFIFENRFVLNGQKRTITLRDYAYDQTTCGGNSGKDTKCACIDDYPLDDQIGVGMDPKVAASEPAYIWRNLNEKDSLMAVGSGVTISTVCQTECNATSITPADFIKQDVEYYKDAQKFDGSSGIGVGTYDEMMRIDECKRFVAFWVTDRGEWNKANPDSCGVLYRCNEKNEWEKFYEPYEYPYKIDPVKKVKPPNKLWITDR